MSNMLTMTLVLGGTFIVSAVLLYLSLKADSPRQSFAQSNTAERAKAVEATAILAAAQGEPASAHSPQQID